jgi:hypothetical protein
LLSFSNGTIAMGIVALLSFELAATVLLLGAQVIAEYERMQRGGGAGLAPSRRTGK